MVVKEGYGGQEGEGRIHQKFTHVETPNLGVFASGSQETSGFSNFNYPICLVIISM